MGKLRRWRGSFEKYHEYIPKELSESIERTRVGLKGPVTTPIGGASRASMSSCASASSFSRNFRPIRNLPHIPTRYPGIDLIVVRENTEGLYSGIEHEVVPGVWRASRSSAKSFHPHLAVCLRTRPQEQAQEDSLHHKATS